MLLHSCRDQKNNLSSRTLLALTLSRTAKKINKSEARKVAELASSLKHKTYNKIKTDNYIFIVFAVETMGPWSEESLTFFDEDVVSIMMENITNFIKMLCG